jgi:hypothetical protein
MSRRRSTLSLNQKVVLWLAVLAIIATLIASFLSGHDWFPPQPTLGDHREIEYVGHVMDTDTLQPIANAKITLTLEGVPPVVYTDNEGIYRFKVVIQSNISGQVRVDGQGYQVYIRNITISPTLDRIDDIRLSPVQARIIGTASSESNGVSIITPTPALSNAIIVVNNFYSWINNAQNKDDLRKAWDLETSGPNGLQCREASGCQYSKFQDSWWLWKVQYKLYDCSSNLVDVELRYFKRDPSITSTPIAPLYVRYQLVQVAGELKIDKGQKIGSPGADCTLAISVP